MTGIGSVRLSVEVTALRGTLRLVYENKRDRERGVWAVEVDGRAVELDDRQIIHLVRALEDGRGVILAEGVFVGLRLAAGAWDVEVHDEAGERYGVARARVSCDEMARLAAIVRPWLPTKAPLRW